MPYIPSMKPVTTIGLDGEAYPSGLEFRFAGMMDLVGMKYEHEGYAFIAPILGGQYKPDFVWELPNGKLGIGEVKGWEKERDIIAADIIRDFCDDPNHPVEEFVYGWSENVLYYNKGRETDGAMFKCHDCGEATWSSTLEKECSFCGSHDLEFICVDFNSYWNDEWQKIYSPTWNRRIKKNETEASILKYIQDFSDKHEDHIDLLPGKVEGKGTICMITESIPPGQWNPDFWYTEQPLSRSQYGTALAPIVLVLVFECPTNNEKHAIAECLRHVADKYSPIVKVVLMDKHTTRVADHFTKAQLEPGHPYKCPKCDGVFFASDNHTQCPYCDNKKTLLLKGKE